MNDFEKYFVNVIRDHYIDFDGRARRKQYWMFTLFNILISFAITLVVGFISEGLASMLSGVLALVLFLPGLGLSVRRLHDTGRSGWFLLIVLIPILGALALLYFMVSEGDAGPNEYGPDPKDPYNDMDEIEDFNAVLDR